MSNGKFYFKRRRRYNRNKKPIPKAVRAYVKRSIDSNIENKFGAQTFPSVTPAEWVLNSTPRFDLLNGLFKGTDRNQRIGNRVKNKSLEIAFYLKAPANTVTTYRLILIKQHQPRFLAPAVADLFTTTANYHLAPIDLNYKGADKNLSIVWDKTFTTSQATNGALCFRKRWRMNSHTQYSDTNNGTILDIISCAYYLFAVTDQGANSDYIAVQQHTWEDA